MVIKQITGKHSPPTHTNAHTHTVLPQSHTWAGHRAECVPPIISVPPSSKRIACATDDSQSHSAVSVRLWRHCIKTRELCACIGNGCVGVLCFSICHFHSLFLLHTHSRTGSGAKGVPSSREDRAVCGVACFNYSWLSQVCGAAVVDKTN